MSRFSYYEYFEFDNEQFFTVVLLPEKSGKFPTIVIKSPYVNGYENTPEEEIVNQYLSSFGTWLNRGYAIVYGHCRGQGKSTGAFIPYVHEHEDSKALRNWIRQKDFYNGELFLYGGSYTASLQYASAPFESDIKGAVFEVQDSERYRLWYRNGQMRKGHANWHFGLYKRKCGLKKNFSMDSFAELPLKNLSNRVLGERADDFEEMLEAPRPEHPFWSTRNGGFDAKDCTDNIPFPTLFTTGYNDFYVGGIFKMWQKMSENSKKNCALLVSPYDHGDTFHATKSLSFENGKRAESFGPYPLDWFDNIRLGKPLSFEKGVITYYRLFENKWKTDFYKGEIRDESFVLGEGEEKIIYNPSTPPKFNPEGIFQDDFEGRNDVITALIKADKDIFVKGQMRAKLTVSSTCPDTSFYICISIRKPEGDYTLRHDITSLSHQLGKYKENDKVTLHFTFDEIAFLLKKGESLRIDIAPTDDNTYVSHTNNFGPYHLQETSRIATNRVYLNESELILPSEV